MILMHMSHANKELVKSGSTHGTLKWLMLLTGSYAPARVISHLQTVTLSHQFLVKLRVLPVSRSFLSCLALASSNSCGVPYAVLII